MIHHDILHEIKRDRQHESFIYPYYGKYSIAEIPPSALAFFGIPSERPALPFPALRNADKAFKRLLVLFVDGLGFDHFIDYEERLPFFHRVKERCDVYPLTSVFPSTTAAALTTVHTNKTPQEHGLPEWTVFFEELDRISFGIFLEKEGVPEMLYKGDTLYGRLKKNGVRPYVFIYEKYVPSSYSTVAHEGATIVTFKDLDDLLEKLVGELENGGALSYYFVYWSEVDGAEHAFGPRSKEHIEALARFSEAFERKLTTLGRSAAADVMFALASDHGQANIRHEDIIYLNEYLDLEENFQLTGTQKTIYPTGAPHDVFLHVRDGHVKETADYLRRELAGKADVLATKEALGRGLFGTNAPSERFLKRIGDVLILPYEGYHVWYQHTPGSRWGQRGIHGGLSQQEMVVPFAAGPLSGLLL